MFPPTDVLGPGWLARSNSQSFSLASRCVSTFPFLGAFDSIGRAYGVTL
jgi:hypothetical protein